MRDRGKYNKANCSVYLKAYLNVLPTEASTGTKAFQAIQLFPGNLNLGPILKKMPLEDCHSCPYIKIGQHNSSV